MRRTLTVTLSALLYILFAPSLGSESTQMIYAFRNYQTIQPIRMILVGEIRSKTKAPEPYKTDSPFLNYDTRLDQITVKVLNRKGLKVGQKLYIIDKKPFHKLHKNGLIVGEIQVRSILHNPFYGWVLTGTGVLLRVREGHFVARTLETENLERAFVMKKRGDHFAHQGNLDRAMASYNEALEADRSLPEAHAALGRIFLELARDNSREDPIRAHSEFKLAWKYRENFRYDFDRFRFYNDYMNALYYRYHLRRNSASREENLLHFLDTIEEVGSEADRLAPGDADVRIHRFRALYYRMRYFTGRQDRTQRDEYETSLNGVLKHFRPLLQDPVSEPEFHRLAVLFYGSLFKEIRNGEVDPFEKVVGELYLSPVYELNRASRMLPRAESTQLRLKELIAYHSDHYYRYFEKVRNNEEPDPEVQEIRRSLL